MNEACLDADTAPCKPTYPCWCCTQICPNCFAEPHPLYCQKKAFLCGEKRCKGTELMLKSTKKNLIRFNPLYNHQHFSKLLFTTSLCLTSNFIFHTCLLHTLLSLKAKSKSVLWECWVRISHLQQNKSKLFNWFNWFMYILKRGQTHIRKYTFNLQVLAASCHDCMVVNANGFTWTLKIVIAKLTISKWGLLGK